MASKQITPLDIFLHWLPLAFVTTVLCGVVYATVQNTIRQAANDPQIEIAHNIAMELAKGAPTDGLSSARKADMATTLSPFIMVFDENKKVVVNNSTISGKTPELPAGVLEEAKKMASIVLPGNPLKTFGMQLSLTTIQVNNLGM